uniref:Troponin I n=1 Tax=Strigamia maritima TaxID=126957 RepID=T1J8Y4_STRMM
MGDKREDKERKKAEVRKRLEEAAKSKKAKKGFMTPERKKKLRVLLRKMAAEQLKAEQEKKAQERRKIIKERCGEPKAIDGANEAAIIKIIQDYHKRIYQLEDNKYDLEYVVRQKDFEINELNIQVNDLRGKFVKPVLKKVNKYDPNKFKIVKPTEINFHQNLKKVEKNTFSIENVETVKPEKPEWALGAKEKREEGEVEE